MNRFKLVKPVTLEAKISDNFPITHLNSPSIFESQSGLVGSVLRVDGIPFEVAEPEVLNHQLFLLHQALIGLDSRFIVYVTTHRHKASCVLTGQFTSDFARDLDERYHQRFANKKAYQNSLYITVVLKGDDSNKTSTWIERIKNMGRLSVELKQLQREKNCTVLQNTVSQLQANLSSFGTALLGEKDKELGYSELLKFLGLVVNAGQTLHFQKPIYNPPIANTIPEAFKEEALYPWTFGNRA